jgi:hypothetical protein
VLLAQAQLGAKADLILPRNLLDPKKKKEALSFLGA